VTLYVTTKTSAVVRAMTCVFMERQSPPLQRRQSIYSLEILECSSSLLLTPFI